MGFDIASMIPGLISGLTGAAQLGMSLWDRIQLQNDPYLNQGLGLYRDWTNQALMGSPFGNPYGGFGGMFGNYSNGQPVQFGDAYSRAIGQLMGFDPAGAATQNYQQMAAMLGNAPNMVDSTAGLRDLLGRGGDMYSSPNVQFNPATAQTTIDPASLGGGNAPQPMGNLFQAPQQGGNDLFGNIFSMLFGGGGGLPYGGGSYYGGGMGGGGGGYGALGSGMFSPGGWGGGGGGFNIPTLQQAGSRFKSAQGAPATGGGTGFGASAASPMLGSIAPKAGMSAQPAMAAPQAQAMPQLQAPQQPQGGVMTKEAQATNQPMTAPTASAAQPNIYQQLLQNPMSFTPQVQQSIINQGTQAIDQNAAAAQRQLADSMGPGQGFSGLWTGRNDAMQRARLQNIADLNQNVGIQAALQNFQDLMGVGQMQLGAESQLANQILQQNQQNAGVFNQNLGNVGRITDQLANLGMMGQQNTLGLFDRLGGLLGQQFNFPQSMVDRLLQQRLAQLVPSPVSQIPMAAYGGGGGYGGQSGGSSGGFPWGAMAGNMLGGWLGNSPWAN